MPLQSIPPQRETSLHRIQTLKGLEINLYFVVIMRQSRTQHKSKESFLEPEKLNINLLLNSNTFFLINSLKGAIPHSTPVLWIQGDGVSREQERTTVSLSLCSTRGSLRPLQAGRVGFSFSFLQVLNKCLLHK